MSTVEIGDALRNYVARLLRAAQYVNVEVEKRIGSKKVDVYFEEVVWGRSARVAIECKNYARPLTKDYVKKEILADYNQLIMKGLIDKVYIIAPQEISPDTRSFLREYNFEFFTVEQFQAAMMDFTVYLSGLRAAYEEGGLKNYYMKPFFGGGYDLEEELLNWVSSSDNQPVAILAGYGMGKTSFAKHFSAYLSGCYITGGVGRIPIYIKLGEISSEQSLEGLLGKVLASAKGVARYSYELFMELNRKGMFVILLDGFDEMKHAISWEQFKFNFEELKKLLEGSSKVVMLGRPSAFLSDYEYSLVIRGVKKAKEKEIRSFAWVRYREMDLDMFTVDRAYEFIGKYISYNIKIVSNPAEYLGDSDLDDFLVGRIDEIKALGIQEIIQRPVQAKMLADIAADPRNKLWSYSRFELYEIFLDHIIDREMQKPSRHMFSGEERRRFIREIAWWLWCDTAMSGFGSVDIPTALIKKYAEGKGYERKDVLRDLISGSILEAKNAESFYFPHRSYQEFLVAEYILECQWTSSNLSDLSGAISPEISNFLKESLDARAVDLICIALSEYKGGLKFIFLEYLAASVIKNKTLQRYYNEFERYPWGVVIIYLVSLNAAVEKMADANADAESLMFKMFGALSTGQRDLKLTSLVCLLLHLSYVDGEHRALLKAKIVGLILSCAMDDIEKIVKVGKKKTRIAVPDGRTAPFMRLVLIAYKADFSSGEMVLKIDFSGLLAELLAILGGDYKFFGLDKIEFDEFLTTYRVISSNYESLNFSEKGGVVASYFREFHDPENMVQVHRKFSMKNSPRFLR